MEKITANHPLSQSADIIKQNLGTLKSLFPTIVKEGKIDMEELNALLGEEVENDEEYYRFTWAGKSQARQEANKPSTGTLRPIKVESKDWDTTKNIFIEGDNLEVLKLLQKSYANKIKMIYIDPPYNTGKDFVYKDNYADNLTNYLAVTGQTDEEGRKLTTNTESDGRYHSNWLNMMYPRLKLARNLLKEDGIIFISIDDHEVQNLKKVCDEIFGEENFLANITIKANPRGRQSDSYIATLHDFLLCYSKNNKVIELDGLPLTQEDIDDFDQFDEDGKAWRELGLRQRGSESLREDRPDMFFPIFVNPIDLSASVYKTKHHTVEVLPRKSDGRDGRWMWGFDKTKDEINRVYARLIKKRNEFDIFIKDYLEREDGIRTKKPRSIWLDKDVNTEAGGKLLKKFFPEANFPYPKPIGLIDKMLRISTSANDIVMDFFAGSGTTAHAVMKLNSEDSGSRAFICVQLQEPIEEKNPASEAGFTNIAQITRERIRRSGDLVKSEMKDDLFNQTSKKLDIGFRAFKLEASNIHAWDGNIQNFEQNLLSAAENIKPGRSEEDVLYEILLKSGLDLAQPIEEKKIAGKKVFSIGIGALFICLANDLSTAIAEGIGKWKEELAPVTCRVIFKDTGFTDVSKTNSMQILKRYGITEVNTI